jgi:tyrosyl-tRNA synthetase
MYGRLMRVPDELIVKYLLLCTDLDPESVAGEPAVEQKRVLAREVVDLYHGDGAGEAVQARFIAVHRKRETPDDVRTIIIPPEFIEDDFVNLPPLLVHLEMAASNSEVRRLIRQGGIRVDGEPVESEEVPRPKLSGKVLQIGRRKFVRLS